MKQTIYTGQEGYLSECVSIPCHKVFTHLSEKVWRRGLRDEGDDSVHNRCSVRGLMRMSMVHRLADQTHLVLVLTDVAHHTGSTNEVVHILVYLGRKRHVGANFLHVCVVPRQDLRHGISGCERVRTRHTSSRMKRLKVPARSNSGIVSDLEIAVVAAVTTPSTPTRVMKCCMFGVRRKGTDSLELMRGWP